MDNCLYLHTKDGRLNISTSRLFCAQQTGMHILVVEALLIL